MLISLCRRLEVIAHKQLRGAPFNREEAALLESYGLQLARLMLYDGEAHMTPNDDAPRVVDVFTNIETGKVLEVGVARARAIYVLYPFRGEEVLCRGAVMPYYEFTHRERLTDEAWMKMLDSADRPALPEWARPIYSKAGLGKPRRDDDKRE